MIPLEKMTQSWLSVICIHHPSPRPLLGGDDLLDLVPGLGLHLLRQAGQQQLIPVVVLGAGGVLLRYIRLYILF